MDFRARGHLSLSNSFSGILLWRGAKGCTGGDRGDREVSSLFWIFALGEVPATGTAGEKGTTEKLRPLWGREGVSTKSSKLWEGMWSRGVKWLTQITNLWVVGLALDPETHGLTSYFSIPAITVRIPQERSRGSQWSKHNHAWTYSCPSCLLALHSGVGRVHRRGRRRSRWGSVRLINELKHPQKVQFHRGWIFGICDPELAYLFELNWASGHHQFQPVTSSPFHMQIATLFHKPKERVALWFCFYKLSYHSMYVLEPRC